MELDFHWNFIEFQSGAHNINSGQPSWWEGKKNRTRSQNRRTKKNLAKQKDCKAKSGDREGQDPCRTKKHRKPKNCVIVWEKCSVATYIWCCLIHGNYLRSFEVTWSMHWQQWGILFNPACFGIAPAFRDSTIYFRHPEILGRPIVRFGGPWCLADGTFLKDSLQPADVKNVFGIWSVGSIMCQTWFIISQSVPGSMCA